jgi:hypothetical protein
VALACSGRPEVGQQCCGAESVDTSAACCEVRRSACSCAGAVLGCAVNGVWYAAGVVVERLCRRLTCCPELLKQASLVGCCWVGVCANSGLHSWCVHSGLHSFWLGAPGAQAQDTPPASAGGGVPAWVV